MENSICKYYLRFLTYHLSTIIQNQLVCIEDTYYSKLQLAQLFYPQYIIRSNRPNKVGLKCPSVRCTYVRTYVRLSRKRFFNFYEIWHVDRGWWVMHDGMQYDLIQGQCHEPSESWKSFHFQKLSPLPFTMGAGNWPLILKLGHNV